MNTYKGKPHTFTMPKITETDIDCAAVNCKHNDCAKCRLKKINIITEPFNVTACGDFSPKDDE